MPEEHKDIEVTPQQDTAPDTSQQKEKWRAIDRIAGGTFIAEVLWGLWWLITQVCRLIPWNPHVSTERFAQFYCGVGLGVLSVGYLTLILWPIIFKNLKQGKDSKEDNDPRWFHARILSSGIVGGSYAFLLPAVMGLEEGSINSGGAAALRQAILLATGGLIGLIALGETRRKNDNDREAAEKLWVHQQDMLNQQKKQFRKQIKKQQQQFEANAFKERKAERRERYTKAVEQLGDEKAPIRMGGVYTLVGLVDEWLEEENLSEPERLKEGQVIINNLCAYIRSPLTLKSRMGNFQPEADVRLGIIKEIHGRLQGSEENTPGTWSEFEYNFSGSRFFYSVDLTNSYYTKSVNFSGSTYKGEANFSGSTYEGEANFNDSTYEGEANFNDSTYQGGANFSGSTYEGEAYFRRSTYQGWANFSASTYQGWANFSASTYQGWANFSDSTYMEKAHFYYSTYKDRAYFYHSTYQNEVYFSDSIYQGGVYFRRSTYKGKADFTGSIYKSWADFIDSTYQDVADFSGSIFYQKVYFGADGDNSSFSRFTDCAPQFYDETNHKNTLFGSPNNDFTVENGRGYPIYRNLEGLPLGCSFLTTEQKEYLTDKFQEIDETKNKLLEIKDPKEKAELSKNLQALTEKLHEWREEATTVKVAGTAPEEEDN